MAEITTVSWLSPTNVVSTTNDAEVIDERTSLIPKKTSRNSSISQHAGESYPISNKSTTDDGDDGTQKSRLQAILSEFTLLLSMSVPVILAYTLQNSLQTISVLIVGRLSASHLAAAAFSYMFAMSTGWLIALGGTTALDTLGATSFTGSSNAHDLGVLLQRALIVLGGMYIPVAALWWWSEPVFLALGQDAQLSSDAAKFLRCLIPGGLGYVYFEAGKKFLQAQGRMRAGTYVLLCTAPLSALLNWLFVYKFQMGLEGAAIGTGVTYWASASGLVGYAYFVGGWEAWGGWDRRCLKNMGTFARLAGLGVVMVGTEWWAFEIVALAAGRLGTVPLAAQSVIMTTDQVLNTIPFGIGVAASTRVGNLLGARSPRGAARAASTAAWLSIFAGSIVLVIMMSVRHSYARIFSSDLAVIRLTAEVMPYVALFQIADGLNGSCGGALRGMGRQHVGAAVNIVSYYLGALPLGLWLAFGGWGLEGLWTGQCIALYLVGAAEWALVAWSDWGKQVRRAFERLDETERCEVGGLVEN